MLFSKKPKRIDILKEMSVTQEDADRILGGIQRLEAEYGTGRKFLKESLKLSKNIKETNLIWYALGLRINLWSELGYIVPDKVYKKIRDKKKGEKKIDPSVQ